MPENNTSGIVGIHGFHWAILDNDDETGFSYSQIQTVRGAQSISVSPTQEQVHAYGDNVKQETAVSNGETEVTSTFHHVSTEDRAQILGWETDENGLITRTNKTTPPDIGIIFYRDKADGSKEMVGLTKGKFTAPEMESSSQQGEIEFGTMELSGSFDARLSDDVTEVLAHVPKDDVDSKEDALFQKIFGQAKPVEDNTTGGTTDGGTA